MAIALTNSAVPAAPASRFALLLAYVLFPISNLASVMAGVELWRNWIDVAWVVLGVVAWLHGLSRQRAAAARPLPLLFTLVIVAFLCIVVGVARGGAPAVTAALEIKPAFYLLVAMLVVRAYGIPREEDFARGAVALSAILIAETLVRTAMSGSLERPIGSGEVNYDAALLVLSLVLVLGRRDLARRFAPWIFLGLLATFSRTSLLAACLVLVFARTVPTPVRVLMVGAASGAALLSFVIRDLEVGTLESLDRYWMWLVGVDHLATHWQTTMLNAAPGAGIDTDIPPFIAELWLSQQEKIDVQGVFPFHFHAMWLRLMMAWGWLPVLFVLLLSLRVIVLPKRRPVQARPFLIACLVLGLTMGLFYLSNVAIPMFFAAFWVLRRLPLRKRMHRPLKVPST